MKTLIAVLLVIFGSISARAETGGVALRTSPGFDAFSVCVAQESLKRAHVFGFKKLLFSGMDKFRGVQKMAYLNFEASTKSGAPIFLKIVFQALDPAGWQLVQGENGEIYPFSKAINPKALLLERKSGSVLGSNDISACLK